MDINLTSTTWNSKEVSNAENALVDWQSVRTLLPGSRKGRGGLHAGQAQMLPSMRVHRLVRAHAAQHPPARCKCAAGTRCLQAAHYACPAPAHARPTLQTCPPAPTCMTLPSYGQPSDHALGAAAVSVCVWPSAHLRMQPSDHALGGAARLDVRAVLLLRRRCD